MPCVLPVLSLKILDFTEMRSKQSSIRSIRLHALSFTAGILVTFQVLNLILIGLRHAGEHVGWGFQLQSPYFVAGLMILFIGLTLNLFGVFEIGLSTLRLGNTLNTDKHKTLVNSFSKGIIACVVATPCSAPFMGTALAAALNHSIGTSIIIFLFLGLGLSLPFLVVCVWPYSVHSFIPKPGPWMVTLKHGMGLFMLASVGWMIWILNTHMHLEYILTPVWCITCALWIYGRLQTLDNRSLKKNILIVLSIACATSAMYALHTGFDQTHTQDTSQWKPFSPEAVQKARDEGKSVLINFTARWCVTCQTNKKFILDSSDIRAHLKDHDVALFIADWTHHDPVITQTLKTFGHNSIPFIAYYKNGEKEPVLLPSILTKQRIYELIK
jgi:thiol:disulfide interchange protein DsbD